MFHYNFQSPARELTDDQRWQRNNLITLAETVLNDAPYVPDAAKYENRTCSPNFVRSARILVPRDPSGLDSWVGIREELTYSNEHDQMWPSLEIWGKDLEYNLNIGKKDSLTVFNPRLPHYTEDKNHYEMDPNTDYFAAHQLIMGALRQADGRLSVTRKPGFIRTLLYCMHGAHYHSEPGKIVRFKLPSP
jgi:hypothetical protein